MSGIAANTIYSQNVLNINSVITRSMSNSGAFSRSPSVSLKLKGNSNAYTDISELALYINTIKILLVEFSKGNFYAVANTLTRTTYDEISKKLLSLAVSPKQYPDYEILRLTYTNAFEGLYQAIIQYASMVDMQVKIDEYKKCCEILHDNDKLMEYIEMLKKRSTLFGEFSVQVKKATLKPQYAEYIKRHGFPEGGIFEMDKMADVLNDLNIKDEYVFS
jgi:hypothetical protein